MDRLKGKYEKLYQMVLKKFENESTLLGKARSLNKEVCSSGSLEHVTDWWAPVAPQMMDDQKKFGRMQESQTQEQAELEHRWLPALSETGMDPDVTPISALKQ